LQLGVLAREAGRSERAPRRSNCPVTGQTAGRRAPVAAKSRRRCLRAVVYSLIRPERRFHVVAKPADEPDAGRPAEAA